MEQVGIVSQWKTVFGWFRWANLKMIVLGTLITIKRSVMTTIKFAFFPGILFTAILVPFYAISSIWLKISPGTLLVSALYVSKPYSDRILRVLPKFLGMPTVALLMFLLFFASFVVPMIVIRASTRRKDTDYLKQYVFPALVLWPLLFGFNIVLAYVFNTLAERFMMITWLFAYPAIPQAVEYIISAWLLAFRLNFGFFYFDAVYNQGILVALWTGIKKAAHAAVYFLPILIIPWTFLIAQFINLVFWLIALPMHWLPAIDFNVTTAIEATSSFMQHFILSLAPFVAITLAALLNILNFSFYSTIFLKIKHQG
jgi:hypothetical protein